MRLNRYLSSCGLGSRRGVEQIILEGRVTINGEVTLNLGTTVADTDEVKVDAKKVRPDKGIVIAFHKPRGYVCTRRDERDRETIYALLPREFSTLHHVGRLDKESEGLLLLTNRGELSHRLMHPSEGVEKEYEVTLETPFDPDHLGKLTAGIHTEEGPAKAERAWAISNYKVGMVLKQGLKRQIRLMMYSLGYEVKYLVRVRIGGLVLKGLPTGGWRELKDSQVQKLLLGKVEKQSKITKKPPPRKKGFANKPGADYKGKSRPGAPPKRRFKDSAASEGKSRPPAAAKRTSRPGPKRPR